MRMYGGVTAAYFISSLYDTGQRRKQKRPLGVSPKLSNMRIINEEIYVLASSLTITVWSLSGRPSNSHWLCSDCPVKVQQAQTQVRSAWPKVPLRKG